MKQQEILKNYEKLDLMKLSEVFQRGGYKYHLIERTRAKLLYAQHDLNAEKIYAYEVFKNLIIDNHKLVKHSCAKLGAAFIPEDYPKFKEAFPGNEEFGKRAWTYPRLDLAKQKYDSLN